MAARAGNRRSGGRARSPRLSPRPVAKLKLLFVNQYYWPDHASTAQHLTDLVESLAAEGHECHVLCARPVQADAPRPPAFEIHNGVHIHRVPATSLGRKNTLFRMTDYLSFYARALCRRSHLAPVRRDRHAHHAADHRPDRDAAPPLEGLATYLLEHGPPPGREPRARQDVAAPTRSSRGWRGSAILSTGRRTRLSSSALTWPIGSRPKAFGRARRNDPCLEPAATKSSPCRARASASRGARAGRQVRRDVLGQPRPRPLDDRIP